MACLQGPDPTHGVRGPGQGPQLGPCPQAATRPGCPGQNPTKRGRGAGWAALAAAPRAAPGGSSGSSSCFFGAPITSTTPSVTHPSRLGVAPQNLEGRAQIWVLANPPKSCCFAPQNAQPRGAGDGRAAGCGQQRGAPRCAPRAMSLSGLGHGPRISTARPNPPQTQGEAGGAPETAPSPRLRPKARWHPKFFPLPCFFSTPPAHGVAGTHSGCSPWGAQAFFSSSPGQSACPAASFRFGRPSW